jgi:CRISPR-associated protein Csa1
MSLDSLVNSAVPVLLEHNISFPEMGFSGDMTPDFVYPQFSAVGELKTGVQSLSHRIAVTGYALAYEKQHNQDVNFGVLLYLDVQDFKAPLYKIDAFTISDVYRRLFVEYRNDKFAYAKKEIEKLQKNGQSNTRSNKANS